MARLRVRDSDVAVTLTARFLGMLRPWVLIATILALCAVVYAMGWIFTKR